MVDRSHPCATDGIGPGVGSPGPWHEGRRGSRGRADSIQSRSVRIGTPGAAGDAPSADTRGLPSRVGAPRTSRARFSRDLLSLRGAVQRPQCSSHFLEQIAESTRDHGRPRDEHDRHVGMQSCLLSAIRFAQASPPAVTDHGAPDAPAHSESNTPALGQWSPQHHKARPLVPIALPKECLDFRGPPKPVAPLQRKPSGRNASSLR